MTFGPTNQALADKLTIHTEDGHNTGDVKITCYQDKATTIVSGFIKLHDKESLTLGWNCELIGEEIWIPAVAKELLNSRLSDTAAQRKRSARQFSIVATNSNGRKKAGIASNDRFSKTASSRASMDNATASTLQTIATIIGEMAALRVLAYLYNWTLNAGSFTGRTTATGPQ